MYFVWKADMIRRKGTLIRGNLRRFREDWYMIYYFSPDPIRHLFPDVMEFDVTGATYGLPDHLFTANFAPCSPRLLSLVAKTGVHYETVPVRLYDKRTGEVLADDYEYPHILGEVEAIDLDRSAGTVDLGERGQPFLADISRIVLRDEMMTRPVPMFRPVEARQLILVHEDFKREYEALGLWGSRFIPLEEYHDV